MAGHLGSRQLIAHTLQRGQFAVTLQKRAVMRCGLLLRLSQLALVRSDVAGVLEQASSHCQSSS